MLPVALTPAALGGCPLFPSAFPTNQRVDDLPVAADSDAIVRSIGLDDRVHPDFGSGRWEGRPIGIPYTVVGRGTKRCACGSTTPKRATASGIRFRAA